jgi:hypothetical protein
MVMSKTKQGVSLDQVTAGWSDARRARVEARAQELIDQEMGLRTIRKALGKTQVEMAKSMGVAQGDVSRLEGQEDMLLSTLDKYVRAAGARLRLVVDLPNHGTVELADLRQLAPGKVSTKALAS